MDVFKGQGGAIVSGVLQGAARQNHVRSLHNGHYATTRFCSGRWTRLGLLLTVLGAFAFPSARAHAGSPDRAPLDPASGWLENGAPFLIIPNRASPLVGAVAIVHGGSGAEDTSTQGASHFLEHLLFNGTASRTQEDIYAEFDRLGVYHNATTRPTHVAYFILAPKENFWPAFAILDDMLFNSTLPPEKLEKERGIILEELAKDRASGTLELERDLGFDLFGPRGYGLPTLGTEESIARLSREEILRFYRDFYGPGRISWVLVGDVDARAARDSLEATVGKLPPRLGPSGTVPGLDPAQPTTRVHYLPIEGPVIQASWEGPDPSATEFNAFHARFGLTAEGADSPLGSAFARVLGNDLLAYGASLTLYPGFSVVSVRLELKPDADPDAAARAISEACATLSPVAIPPEAIAGWKTRREAEEAYLREKPHYYGIGRAGEVAARGLFAVGADLRAIRELDVAAVQSAPLPFAGTPARVSICLPHPEPDSADVRGARELSEFTLENGVHVLVGRSDESPVFAAHLFIRDRSRREPPGQAGVAEMLHTLLARGSAHVTPEEWARTLDRLGAELKTADDPSIPYDDAYSVPDFSFVRFQTLDRFAEEALAQLTALLQTPRLDRSDFDAAKESMRQRAARSAGSGRDLARRLARRAVGREYSVFGTETSIAATEFEDLERFARSYLGHPEQFWLVVATSHDLPEVRAMLDRTIGGLSSSSEPVEVDLRPATSAADRCAEWIRMSEGPDALERLTRALPGVEPSRFAGLATHADSAGGAQSGIVLSRLVELPPDSLPALELAAAILSDRVAFQLREREGLAYSIGVGLERMDAGVWLITSSAATRPENLTRIATGFQEALETLAAAPPSLDEVERTAARVYGRGLMRRATRMQWAFIAGTAWLSGDDPRDLDRKEQSLTAVRPEAIQAVIREYVLWRPGILAVGR